jgi:hypothetical protein
MSWIVRVTISAQKALSRLNPTSIEVDQVVSLLKALAKNPFPGERVPFTIGRDLLYSDVGRFRIIFQLRVSTFEPPGDLEVVGFIAIRS